MSYKAQSIAKILTVLSIATALTSAHFGLEWHSRAQALEHSNASALKTLRDNEKEVAHLSNILKRDGEAKLLHNALSELLLVIYNSRTRHGVTLTTVAPAKLGASSNGMSQANALADDLPGTTNVKSVKLTIAGTYKTYPELVAYLKNLTNMSVSLSTLKVQEKNFEAGVRLYGVGE